jgi:hypothetical protein
MAFLTSKSGWHGQKAVLFGPLVRIPGSRSATLANAAQNPDHNMTTPEQNQSGQTMQNMPGMGEVGHEKMSMKSHSLIDLLEHHATSGTDAAPNSTPFEMLMTKKGNWTLMFHGEAFLNELQQSGPRGADKLFSTNWFMPMAQRKFGNGKDGGEAYSLRSPPGLGFLVRCAAWLPTVVLTLGLSFVSLLRAFMQTLLCFRILDAVLHALRVGYSLSVFDTGLRGFTLTSPASLRGACV